jgi:hypothetical protein
MTQDEMATLLERLEGPEISMCRIEVDLLLSDVNRAATQFALLLSLLLPQTREIARHHVQNPSKDAAELFRTMGILRLMLGNGVNECQHIHESVRVQCP